MLVDGPAGEPRSAGPIEHEFARTSERRNRKNLAAQPHSVPDHERARGDGGGHGEQGSVGGHVAGVGVARGGDQKLVRVVVAVAVEVQIPPRRGREGDPERAESPGAVVALPVRVAGAHVVGAAAAVAAAGVGAEPRGEAEGREAEERRGREGEEDEEGEGKAGGHDFWLGEGRRGEGREAG